MMSRHTKVLIMAGGTGGHIFPGLAIAQRLRDQEIQVCWLGTRQGLEARLVPEVGFAIHFIRISGLRGKGIVGKVLAPFLIVMAILQSIWVILRVRPQVVVGMGGFVSGPGGVAAWLLRRPLLIHEQNAIPGFTNRLLARLAVGVMEAFPGSFSAVGISGYPIQHTGNPVRSDIVSLSSPSERLRKRGGALRVLVLGGSQGAEILNEVVPEAIGALADPTLVTVRHQVGAKHLVRANTKYEGLHIEVELVSFIEDMAGVYEWADVVIGRAGAMTVTELAAAGVASILVPYPFAVDDHQTANARFLADVGAAVLIPQSELTGAKLARLFAEFYTVRSHIVNMAEAARGLSMPDAAERVVARCMEAVDVCFYSD